MFTGGFLLQDRYDYCLVRGRPAVHQAWLCRGLGRSPQATFAEDTYMSHILCNVRRHL